MKREDITPEILNELLRYEPDTGKLFWKERPLKYFKNERLQSCFNSQYANRELNTLSAKGYIRFNINNINFKSHRAAWAIYHNKMPTKQIDHINHIKTDNRICNLREVSNLENQRNRSADTRNKSGHSGIRYRPDCPIKPYSVNLSQGYYGSYSTIEEALAVRDRVYEELGGFHENHGKS